MQVSIESDEETWQSEPFLPNVDVWNEICDEFDVQKKQIEEYKKTKLTDCDFIQNPAVKYLDEEVFVILKDILEKTLFKAMETNSLQYHKSPFNPMDFISENLWNLNPKHPDRQENWTNLFRTDWVKEHLKLHPRPHFPFSWIWTKDYAALKIQSYMRGYWVRRREDVQEVRQFWKDLLEEKLEIECQPAMMTCECGNISEGNTEKTCIT